MRIFKIAEELPEDPQEPGHLEVKEIEDYLRGFIAERGGRRQEIEMHIDTCQFCNKNYSILHNKIGKVDTTPTPQKQNFTAIDITNPNDIVNIARTFDFPTWAKLDQIDNAKEFLQTAPFWVVSKNKEPYALVQPQSGIYFIFEGNFLEGERRQIRDLIAQNFDWGYSSQEEVQS
jgi:hypothetical protein